MRKPEASEKAVIVAGDMTVDWNLACSRGRAEGQVWSALGSIRAGCQPGGAAMLAALAAAVAREVSRGGKKRLRVSQIKHDWEKVTPTDPRFHHSYALWSKYDKDVWRVSEFLGLDHRASPPEDEGTSPVRGDSTADLIILDDANLGFRSHPGLWPRALEQAAAGPWILLKMSSPIAQGPLWDKLYREHADRLIVVAPVNDLRLTEVQVSRDLSWEHTAQDLFWELTHNPRVNGLSQCAHVVISFKAAGALLLSRTKTGPRCTLVFDPRSMEGTWEAGHPGHLIGYTTCLTAGIAREIMRSAAKPDLLKGIQAGLTALRHLHLGGYDLTTAGPDKALPALLFPYEKVAAVLAGDGGRWDTIEVPATSRQTRIPAAPLETSPAREWTILQEKYPNNLNQIARQTVVQGIEASLAGVPLGEFGGLVTVDRREIESLRSIRNLIREYCCHAHLAKPVSIAVFGPPGSGKSFAIKKIAKSLARLPQPIEAREFNLSQFQQPEDLLGALHQVRDVGLGGKMPLIFWDEFDTALGDKPLGWLRYFLAPMQDGTFQEGQITHPIGRAIFVFAGGTSHTMEGFSRGQSSGNFKTVKGPDFVSRLRGYVNIMGPNRRDGEDGLPSDDLHFIIRRAIILRVLLKLHWEKLFQQEDGKELLHIDPGVLHALLEVSRYKHGARSMEAVINMSSLAHKTRFERSSLPPEAQLDLHVHGREFLDLVQTIILPEDTVERLAAVAHRIYCDKVHGTEKHSGGRTCCKDYRELDAEEKEQNRAFVRDIPHKLAQVGYRMVPGGGHPQVPEITKIIEKMAEAEHLRWVKAKIENGWRYGPKTDKTRKVHQALLWWRKLTKRDKADFPSDWLEALGKEALPEVEKQKNRDMVQEIPEILNKAGYSLVRK